MPIFTEIIEEERALSLKVRRLGCFLTTRGAEDLEEEDRILLIEQCEAMVRYRSMLRARILRNREEV